MVRFDFATMVLLCACGQSSPQEEVQQETMLAPEASPSAAEGANASAVELSPDNGPLLDQLMAHADQAQLLGRKPVIYVHANWCEPCIMIDRYAQDPSMVAAFAGTHIARVNQDLWHEQLAAFRLNGSIPVWANLDADGYPGARRIGGGAWGENIPANMAGPLGEYFSGL